jgi:transcriptional regulator with XRE-family HTH domain
MTARPVGTYLRFLRKKSGLSQRALAEILGAVSESQVSRHEVVFQKPISEIFPGLYHAVEISIEERLDERAKTLGGSDIDDPIREFIARRAGRQVNREDSD